ncbi:MAG: metal ABC transporter permease [Beijerinckiaceae bacterium]|jgi:zinc/manganese transport system permease protein|nr:metal ABC transporter permease [Beijerinckiaceae bacterium]
MLLYDLLIGPFVEFPFMRRALVGGLAVSLGAAPIGLFLMLRRMSLIGDAMAHAILPGAALGFLIGGLSLGAMTIGGLVAGFSVALLAGAISRATLVKEDMALAAFYLLSLATGVLILSGAKTNIDVLSLLFGSILALDDPTLLLIVSVASLTMAALAMGYRGLLLECLDPGFAAGVSRHGALFHLGFLALVVLNLVAGFHALGTLLVVGIMMLPAGTARLWSDDVTAMLGIAVLAAMVSNFTGLLISYHFGLASGPAIILVAGLVYVASLIVAPLGLMRRLMPRRHLEA